MNRLVYPVLLAIIMIAITTETYAQHEDIMHQVNAIKKMAAADGYMIEDEGGGMINYKIRWTFDRENFGADYQYAVYAFTYTSAFLVLHFEDFKSGQILPLSVKIKYGDRGVKGGTFFLNDNINNFGRISVTSNTDKKYYIYSILFSRKK